MPSSCKLPDDLKHSLLSLNLVLFPSVPSAIHRSHQTQWLLQPQMQNAGQWLMSDPSRASPYPQKLNLAPVSTVFFEVPAGLICVKTGAHTWPLMADALLCFGLAFTHARAHRSMFSSCREHGSLQCERVEVA